MLSGEGNENGELAKKQLCTCSTFLYRCFARPERETSRNFLVTRFMEEMSYLLLFTFFHTLIFTWWPLGFLIFSPPLNLFFQKIAPYLLLQLSVAFFLVELRWPVADFIFSLYSKFVDMTIINLSLIQRIQKQFPLSVFVLIGSLVVSASQDADGYAISRQNNLVLYLGCHTCWLSYFTLVYLWYGPTVGQAYGHVITKISRMGRLPNFLTHGAPLSALRARGAPLKLKK